MENKEKSLELKLTNLGKVDYNDYKEMNNTISESEKLIAKNLLSCNRDLTKEKKRLFADANRIEFLVNKINELTALKESYRKLHHLMTDISNSLL